MFDSILCTVSANTCQHNVNKCCMRAGLGIMDLKTSPHLLYPCQSPIDIVAFNELYTEWHCNSCHLLQQHYCFLNTRRMILYNCIWFYTIACYWMKLKAYNCIFQEPSKECEPYRVNVKPIAPCGAIANSMFNGKTWIWILVIVPDCFLKSCNIDCFFHSLLQIHWTCFTLIPMEQKPKFHLLKKGSHGGRTNMWSSETLLAVILLLFL